MSTRLLPLLPLAVLAAACDDAVPLPPPRAPIQSPPIFQTQQAYLPPGAGYQPAWPSSSSAPIASVVPVAPAPRQGGSVSNAQAVVAGMAAAFRRCYNLGLQEDPEMKGSVRVTAKIAADGSVSSATPAAFTLSDKIVACVVARVASAQFNPPEGGGATVVIPVTFITKDPPSSSAPPVSAPPP
jgi:hypothetical protein